MAKVIRTIADTNVVSDNDAGSLSPEDVEGAELPPAGYSREEELLRRQDELEKRIEALTGDGENKIDRVAVDASKIEKENEILNFLDNGSYPVQDGEHDLYVYSWTQRDIHGRYGGTHVFRKKALGWEICMYGNPEKAGMRSPEGYCIIGDVLLMRCRKDLYLRQRQHIDKITELRRAAADSEFRQVGDRARSSGIIARVEEELTPTQLKNMSIRAEARRKANTMSDQWIREGRMPGVPGAGR